MRCDRCEKEATIHEIVVVNGKKQARHLCEEHAREAGLLGPSGPSKTIQSLLQGFSAPASAVFGGASVSVPPASVCSSCGLSFSAFRKAGALGCPSCYEVFADRLAPLLQRSQEGAAQHVGKSPKRRLLVADRLHRVQALRGQLREALAAERYEHAAQLRDAMEQYNDANDKDGVNPSGQGAAPAPAASGPAAKPRAQEGDSDA